MVLVVMGYQGFGGLLIIAAILAYFLVDPVLFLLDLGNPKGEDGEEGRSRGSGK
jgi:hypothetical protein